MSIKPNTAYMVDFPEVREFAELMTRECTARGGLSLNEIMIGSPERIMDLLNSLRGPDDFEHEEYLSSIRVEAVQGFIECKDVIVLFTKVGDGDAALIYLDDNKLVADITFNGYEVISCEPFVLLSLHLAALGVVRSSGFLEVLTLDEGDPGWD
jgi:hypothetical protein